MVITNGIGNTYAYAGPNQGLFVNGNNVTVEIPFVPNGEPVVRFLWQGYGAVSGTISLTKHRFISADHHDCTSRHDPGMDAKRRNYAGRASYAACRHQFKPGRWFTCLGCLHVNYGDRNRREPECAPAIRSEVTPSTNPGAYFHWYGHVSAANTVTVELCNGYSSSETPTAATYAVRVY